MSRRFMYIGVAAGVTLASLVVGPTADAAVIAPPAGATVVGVAGPNCPAPTVATIQAAVDAAAADATIYVCAGLYTEQVTINKPLTLLGAQHGVDARTVRTVVAEETVLAAPTGAIVYVTGATTGTLDGFTLQDADTAAVLGINNTGAQAYTFVDNIVTNNTVGFNFQTVGPAITQISQNRFITNNKNPANPTSGSSIFIT